MADVPGMTLNSMPQHPMTPTPPVGLQDLMVKLYGPQAGQSLPSYLPPDVQHYMRTTPSYGEGEVQGDPSWGPVEQGIAQEPPQPLDPRIAELHNMFRSRLKEQGPPMTNYLGDDLARVIRGGSWPGGIGI